MKINFLKLKNFSNIKLILPIITIIAITTFFVTSISKQINANTQNTKQLENTTTTESEHYTSKNTQITTVPTTNLDFSEYATPIEPTYVANIEDTNYSNKYTAYLIDIEGLSNYLLNQNNSGTISYYLSIVQNPHAYLCYLPVYQEVVSYTGSTHCTYNTDSTFKNEKICFYNTTDVPVNLSEYLGDEMVLYLTIPANSCVVYLGEDVSEGERSINLITEDGRELTGTIQVRISDDPLNPLTADDVYELATNGKI